MTKLSSIGIPGGGGGAGGGGGFSTAVRLFAVPVATLNRATTTKVTTRNVFGTNLIGRKSK